MDRGVNLCHGFQVVSSISSSTTRESAIDSLCTGSCLGFYLLPASQNTSSRSSFYFKEPGKRLGLVAELGQRCVGSRKPV